MQCETVGMRLWLCEGVCIYERERWHGCTCTVYAHDTFSHTLTPSRTF